MLEVGGDGSGLLGEQSTLTAVLIAWLITSLEDQQHLASLCQENKNLKL